MWLSWPLECSRLYSTGSGSSKDITNSPASNCLWICTFWRYCVPSRNSVFMVMFFISATRVSQ